MKKDQALKLIEELTAQMKLTRQEHVVVAQAISVLNSLEEPKIDNVKDIKADQKSKV